MPGTNDRPDVNPKYTAVQKAMVAASIALLLFHFGIITLYWASLPEKVVSHYGLAGKPDAWRSRGSLWALPLISLVQCLIMILLSLVPRSYNYPFRITTENALRQYSLARSLILFINFEIVTLFFYITWSTIRIALGQATELGPLFIAVFLGILMATIGAYFYLARKYKLGKTIGHEPYQPLP